jgi:uncharacterized protein
VDDPERAWKFYEEVFDWKINPVPDMDYTVVHTGLTDDEGMVLESGFVNGGLRKRTNIDTTVVVIQVQNIDKTMDQIMKHGGQLVEPKMTVGKMGLLAYAKDSENNVIGVWQNI